MLALVSCGGGGGGGGAAATPTPPAPTPPTPTPPPGTPVPIALPSQGFIYTAEFSNSTYLSLIRADGAYAKGATGNGIRIALIDGGVVDTSPEFAGKVISHVDLTGVSPGGGAADHGTAVASLMVAVRDSAGLMGAAYGATLYDLNVFQAGIGPGASRFADDTDIAAALDVVSGLHGTYSATDARVVNMSLGSNSAFDPIVVTALANVAALDKVIVIAAGNDGAAVPQATARVASDASLRDYTLIVGAVTAGNVMAPFSNRAGGYGSYYIVAPGVNLPVVSNAGGYANVSGTSAAAPLVSAAVAIVAEAFPFLSAPELVRLLKVTATDLGNAGVDSIYGNGLLNLEAALNPVGPLMFVSGSSVGSASTPMGSIHVTTGSVLGGLQSGTLAAFDSFNRPYNVGTASLAGAAGRSTLFDRVRGVGGATLGTGMGSLLSSWQGVRGAQLMLTSGNAVTGSSNTYAVALTDRLVGAMFRNARPSQLMAIEGVEPATAKGQPLFAVTADNAVPESAFFNQGLSAVAYGFRGDGYFASLAYGAGENAQAEQSRLMQASLGFKAAGINWGVTASLLSEEETVLGGYTSGSNLKGAYGRTSFTTLSASYAIEKWSLDFAYTHADVNDGALATGLDLKNVRADAMSLTLSGPAGLRDDDMLGFRVAQPLRAVGGSVEAFLPVGRTMSGEIIRANQSLKLGPTGREIDLELAYATPLPEIGIGQGADLRLNAFYVTQPGNLRNASDAIGAAMQFTFAW